MYVLYARSEKSMYSRCPVFVFFFFVSVAGWNEKRRVCSSRTPAPPWIMFLSGKMSVFVYMKESRIAKPYVRGTIAAAIVRYEIGPAELGEMFEGGTTRSGLLDFFFFFRWEQPWSFGVLSLCFSCAPAPFFFRSSLAPLASSSRLSALLGATEGRIVGQSRSRERGRNRYDAVDEICRDGVRYASVLSNC